MENHQGIRKCANCLHRGVDDNLNPQCKIGYEMHTGRCAAFASQNAEIEENFAKEIVSNSISTPLTYIGLTVLALTILVCFIAGFKVAGDYALLAMIATGILCLALAVTSYYMYRSRRKEMERNVRNDIENMVRRELISKRLTKELINEYLTRNNYLPEQTEDNGGFIFTFHGVLYAVYYEADRMTIRYATTLEQTQIATMEALLKCRDNKTFAIDFWIQEYTNDNGESSYVLECTADFFVAIVDQFEKLFPIYLAYVEYALKRIYNTFNTSIEAEQKGEMERRPDIYNPEYIWFSGLVESISKKQVSYEALTDEEWIRGEIQRRCNDGEIRTEWDSFKINRVESYANYKLIVYQFPEPKVVPEAKYGIVLLNIQTSEASYYTLEMSDNDIWYYGGVENERHLNYGPAESDSLDKFIQWVLGCSKAVVTSTDYTKA